MSVSSEREDERTIGNEMGAEWGGNAKIDDMLCFALYAASRAVMDVYRPLLEELGLT
ncbi:MAG: hypothetical protein JO215_03030, partial [Ktedonobacteraceae bacterium]|nr:hypothetical protein [Ktedonobacteraceae bacterium]